MPQFDNPMIASQLFWLVITMGILYVFITRSFLPNMMKRLTRREDTLAKWSAEMTHNLAETERLNEDSRRMLHEARMQAVQIVREASEKMLEEHRLLDVQLEERLQAKLSRAQDQIAESLASAKSGIAEEVAGVSTVIVERLIHAPEHSVPDHEHSVH